MRHYHAFKLSVQANVVSEIAHSDWPDEWPQLLDALTELLRSGQADSVHGALRVMTDFVSEDLAEDQLLPLADTILPQLLQIVCSEHQYSVITRSQSVSIFRQCLSTLYMVNDMYPEASRYARDQVLPHWLDAFKLILGNEMLLEDRSSELHVRNEIFQVGSNFQISHPTHRKLNLISSNAIGTVIDLSQLPKNTGYIFE